MKTKRIIGIVIIILVAAAGAGLYAKLSPSGHESTTTPQPTASPVASATSAATVHGNECQASQLTLALQPEGGAAGTSYQTLILNNISTTTCTLAGYPGVSLIDASGAQIGQPATRNPARTAVTLTLAPGASVHSSVGFPNPGNFDGGTCSATSAAIKVYPPDETHALTISLAEQACAGWSVNALAAGLHD